jgi:hypothetical protein
MQKLRTALLKEVPVLLSPKSQLLHSVGKMLNDKSKARSTARTQSYATHAMSTGTWSNTETAKFVTPYAEGLLQASKLGTELHICQCSNQCGLRFCWVQIVRMVRVRARFE